MGRSIVDWYNDLVPGMNDLIRDNDNLSIWEYHDRYCGYGFNAIFRDKNLFIRVWVNYDLDDIDSEYIITLQEKTGSVLMGKELAGERTKSAAEVFKIINKYLS